MFDNVGGKVKTLASVVCWLGIIGASIYGIVLVARGLVLTGLIAAAVGAFSSWIGSLGLYAIGEAAENSAITVRLLEKAAEERRLEKQDSGAEKEAKRASAGPEFSQDTPPVNTVWEESWVCPKCKTKNRNSLYCKNCGEYR